MNTPTILFGPEGDLARSSSPSSASALPTSDFLLRPKNPAHEPIKIVLTGGPCGGKTTCLSHISEHLASLGFRVFLVPEAATMLFQGGVNLAGVTHDYVNRFEWNLIRTQLSLEEIFTNMARHCGHPSVVICDRGTMDAAAYLEQDAWEHVLRQAGWNEVELRDRRYDGVIHLVTAAEGAEAFYTTANNTARQETPARARELDTAIQRAWLGHSHLRVIDNSTPFAEKVKRVVDEVCLLIDARGPLLFERRFLVRSCPSPLPVPHKDLLFEQSYLITAEGRESRIRVRQDSEARNYTLTIKRPDIQGQRIEIKRQLSEREYLLLLESNTDPNRRPIRKRRRCFLWRNHAFNLDTFIEPREGLQILEAEINSPDQPLDLPPWIHIEREVTHDPSLSSFAIAHNPQ